MGLADQTVEHWFDPFGWTAPTGYLRENDLDEVVEQRKRSLRDDVQRVARHTSHFMHDVRDRGIRAIVADTLETIGGGPVFVSIDVDVLDPAFAPGTGTPEPGGMTSADLLWAAREIGAHIELVGADVVEVLPDRIGTLDITALVADRVIRELLTGVAVARVREPVAALG
jgi:arginase family enzyme